MRQRMEWLLAAAVMCVVLAGCDRPSRDPGSRTEADKSGIDKMSTGELRTNLRAAIEANRALAERVSWYDPDFASSMEKARAARRIGDKEGSKVGVKVKTNVKVLDLDLLSPVEDDPAPAGGNGTNVDTKVSVLNTRILSPSSNDQVRAMQASIQALCNRIAQQDIEIARLTTKLAKNGINPAAE